MARDLEKEFDTLKGDLETLRKDVGSLVAALGENATDQVRAQGRRARAVAERATDRTMDAFDAAVGEVNRRGRDGINTLEQQIEERPLISVLMALGVGVVIGRMMDR